MHRLIAVLTLAASAAMGAGIAPCYSIVPGDRLSVPANAPAFIGPSNFSNVGTLSLQQADGGVRELDQLDGGRQGFFSLFAPGTVSRGDQIVLQSSVPTCAGTSSAGV